jgi:hypothetical protein
MQDSTHDLYSCSLTWTKQGKDGLDIGVSALITACRNREEALGEATLSGQKQYPKHSLSCYSVFRIERSLINFMHEHWTQENVGISSSNDEF